MDFESLPISIAICRNQENSYNAASSQGRGRFMLYPIGIKLCGDLHDTSGYIFNGGITVLTVSY